MKTLSAHAKINLTLSVTGTEGDFHALDMIVASIDLADEITLLESDCEPRVDFRDGKVACGFVPAESNALRAVRGMAALCGKRGAHILVTKNIPDQCGLGGSSAEAAGIVRLLCEEWGVPLASEPVRTLCMALGSDVFAMLTTGWKRVRGRGEHVEQLPVALTPCIVLVSHGTASTKEVFSAYDGAPTSTDNEPKVASLLRGELPAPHNDLTQAACAVAPCVGRTLSLLRATGAPCGMTGSGACCFAVARSEAEALRIALAVRGASFFAVCHVVV